MNEFDQLEGLDLRINIFKGGRDDLILRSSKYKDKKVQFRLKGIKIVV